LSTPVYAPAIAYGYGTFVQAAYQLFAANPKSLTPPITSAVQFPAGYEIAFYLTAIDRFCDVSEREFYGFVAVSTAQPSNYVVAIRGTDKIIEWLIDAEACPTPFVEVPAAGHVEDGFYSVYRSLAGLMPDGQTPQDLHAFFKDHAPAANVVIVGHSLGGAVANLLALDATVNDGATALTLCTFAAPRTGFSGFATLMAQKVPVCWRIFNEPDLVPRIPPLYDQLSVGQMIDSRTVPAIRHSVVCYHSLASYLRTINPQSTYALASECAASA
jgi:hypothetical protein